MPICAPSRWSGWTWTGAGAGRSSPVRSGAFTATSTSPGPRPAPSSIPTPHLPPPPPFPRDSSAARPEAGPIVHAHPTHATALAVQRLAIPAFHYMVAAAGGHDIRCARYATYGTEELSQHALAALEGRRACLLANHGMIAFGADLRRAFALPIEVETLSHQYLLARATGTPVILEAQEMDRVLEKFKS